ncbi:MAG: PilZ domain-containing protein [Pseudolabrys sp.]
MKEKRKSARHRVGVLAALMTGQNKLICFGAVEDVSVEGAKLKLTKDTELPDSFEILLASKDGPRRRCSVIWRRTGRVGVRFQPIEEAK